MRTRLLILCSLCWALSGKAQHNKLITLHLDSVNVQTFATTIEQQCEYRFFYDSEKFKAHWITIHAEQQDIMQVLKTAFPDSSGIRFLVNKTNVFLTESSINSGTDEHHFLTLNMVSKKQSVNNKKATSRENITIAAQKLNDNKLYTIGDQNLNGNSKATIAGYIRNSRTGEGVSNASVYVKDLNVMVQADQMGYYSLTIVKGRHVLKITSLGMSEGNRHIQLNANGKFNIDMLESITSLKTVTIKDEKSSNIRSTRMGAQRLDIKSIKQMPALMGESDILRALQTLPGVTTVGEGSAGFNVRGGAVDQNLVLLDGSTIYNPSHFFGFFSGFNPDLTKDAELYKIIPVRYGGRISSVLEVITREGNHNKTIISGGIGPLNGRLNAEGPIGKKITFIGGGRATYANWLLKVLPDDAYKRSKANFQDGNFKLSYNANDRNNFSLSGYLSNDNFRLDRDTTYQYGNKNIMLKWKHIYNNKVYGVTSLGYDNYGFSVKSTNNPVNAFNYSFGIHQWTLKEHMVINPSPDHKIEAGISFIRYRLQPGTYQALDKGLAISNTIPDEHALESALYVGDNYAITSSLSLEAGLRYSIYNYMGPHMAYIYKPGLERKVENITDTISYPSGRIIKTYHGVEPRISMRYALSGNNAIKAAFTITKQYVQMLSNTTAVSPTDIWKLSDAYILPQKGKQLTVGYYQNLVGDMIELSFELYYKWIDHAISYKNGANLALNQHLATDVANAKGKSYGLELLVKKTAGRLNGWLSYTYSRTFLRMDDPLVPDPVNDGKYYPAEYDKPHIVNFIGNYKFSRRFSISLTANYSTGRPITLPTGRYYMFGSYRVYYSDRNQYRIPDYFRTDLSVNIEGNHRIKKLAHSSWTLGVYNVMARRNPYSVYFTSENGVINGYKYSIFGSALPYLTYNFKF